MISVKVIFCQFKLIFTIQEFIVFQDAQNVMDINYFFYVHAQTQTNTHYFNLFCKAAKGYRPL